MSVVSASDDFVTLLITDLGQRRVLEEAEGILKPMGEAIEALKRRPPADPEERRALDLLERQGVRLLGLVEDLSKVNPKE